MATSSGRGQRTNRSLTALVLVFAAAAGGGAWLYFDRHDAGPNLSLVGPPEPSLTATAFSAARDLGSFLQQNVTRDLSHIASLLDRSPEDNTDEVKHAEPAVPMAGEPQDRVADTTASQVFPEPPRTPALRLGLDPLPVAALTPESPLFVVFDYRNPEVVPPGTGPIRMRTDVGPGRPLREALAADSQLDAKPLSGIGHVGLVEVVIAETGYVEHVKLLTAPRDVHESMLLSAVKAWHFDPAVKNGQAVRYRQVIPITVARW